MSEEDRQRTAESEARGAELKENVALTDARRTEEEVAKAGQEAEAATKRAEKLSRKELRQREKADRLHEAADEARATADEAAAEKPETAATVSGARVASPGVGSHTDPDAAASASQGVGAVGIPGADRLPPAAQRPEVMIAVAFAGAFLAARILKRIFD